MKEQAEQLVENVQELIESLQQVSLQNGLDEKRVQLKAVSKSIQHLEKQEVAVPDELRHLKMDLASDLGMVDEAEATLGYLSHELTKLIDTVGKRRRSRKAPSGRGRRPRKPTTGREELRELITQSLRQLGGRARMVDVLDWMEKQLDGRLQPGDLELRSGGALVWRNNAQWERLRMVREGMLKSDSPRGWWELAEGG